MAGNGVIKVLISILLIIIISGFLLIILSGTEENVSNEVVSREVDPLAELPVDQQIKIKQLDEVVSADECDQVALKDHCYLKFGMDNKDQELCGKIVSEKYKTICLEAAA